jgi:hypothetical protein
VIQLKLVSEGDKQLLEKLIDEDCQRYCLQRLINDRKNSNFDYEVEYFGNKKEKKKKKDGYI